MFFSLTKEKANAKLNHAFLNGDFKPAIAAYQKLILKDNSDHELFNDLGVAYLESGNISESVKALKKATQLSDTCINWNNYGRALLKHKFFSESRVAFSKARALDSKDPQPWYNIVVSLREEGLLSDSLEELKSFLLTFKNHCSGQSDLGCHYLEQEKISEAILCFEHAIASNQSALPPRLNLIRLLCDQGRYPESMKHLEAIAKLGMQVKVDSNVNNVTIQLNGQVFYNGNARN